MTETPEQKPEDQAPQAEPQVEAPAPEAAPEAEAPKPQMPPPLPEGLMRQFQLALQSASANGAFQFIVRSTNGRTQQVQTLRVLVMEESVAAAIAAATPAPALEDVAPQEPAAPEGGAQ